MTMTRLIYHIVALLILTQPVPALTISYTRIGNPENPADF